MIITFLGIKEYSRTVAQCCSRYDVFTENTHFLSETKEFIFYCSPKLRVIIFLFNPVPHVCKCQKDLEFSAIHELQMGRSISLVNFCHTENKVG
jgi:hypothetical protein